MLWKKAWGVAAATDEMYLTAASGAVKRAKWGMFCIPGIATLDHVDLAADQGMKFIRIGPAGLSRRLEMTGSRVGSHGKSLQTIEHRPMEFSQEWHQLYRQGKQLSRWPWSDLVVLVHRHAAPADGFRRVLELGCGAGAKIPFFLKLRAECHAIEGSAAIVDQLHVEFPDLDEQIVLGDFTRLLPFEGLFALVGGISLRQNRNQLTLPAMPTRAARRSRRDADNL